MRSAVSPATTPFDLVVIEAPGKLRAMRFALSKLRVPAEVTATLGHLYDNPRSLRPVAIERNDVGDLVELQRRVVRPNVVAQLVSAIGRCQRLVIATDDDQEGHVIAQDIAGVTLRVRPELPVLRLRTAGLDPASVRDAWSRMAPLDGAEALPGNARRLADRLIGAAYTNFATGVAVGRVQAAVLGMCGAGEVRRRIASVPVPAADGGRPFQLSIELPDTMTEGELRGLAAQLPAASATSVVQVPRVAPMNGGDALLALESDLGLTIDAAADLLQELYESGRISYPRTSSRGMSAGSAEEVARLASVRGILAFKRDAMPRHRLEDGPHEAIRVLASDVNLIKPLSMRSSMLEAAEAAIARRTIEAGVPGMREVSDTQGLPAWARTGRLVRDTHPRLPWSRPTSDAALQVRVRSPEGALVAAMVAAGVGRPSTWAGHASRLVKRQLVDELLRLTPAGVACMAAAPAVLRSPAGSRVFEAHIEAAGSATERVDAALAAVDAQAAISLVAVSVRISEATDDVPEQEFDSAPSYAPSMIEEERDEYVYRFGR